MPYEAVLARFAGGDCGAGAAGAALALWRAATDAGFRAWCYECGFPDSYTHSVTVIEANGALEVHDAFFNQEYQAEFFGVLDGLRGDRLPAIRRETRDRKIYVLDPVSEPRRTLEWLVVHADRELEPVGSLRRFELQWDEAAFVATHPDLDHVYRALEEHGHPAELAYLMLHPVAVFDGIPDHRDHRTMPIVGGRGLQLPSAALRVGLRRLTRELVAERQEMTERAAAARLESELGLAKTGTAAAEQKVRELERQIAELRGEGDRSDAAWQAEREALIAAIAASDRNRRLEAEAAVRANAELASAETRLAAARALVTDWREAFEQGTCDWAGERRSLTTASEALADDNSRLAADLARAREDAATARDELAAARAALAELTADRDAGRIRLEAVRRKQPGRWRRLGIGGVLRALVRPPAAEQKLSPARGRTM